MQRENFWTYTENILKIVMKTNKLAASQVRPDIKLKIKGNVMENTHDTDDWGEEMDSSEHSNTYNLFLGLIKWGSIAVSAVLLFLLFFVYF